MKIQSLSLDQHIARNFGGFSQRLLLQHVASKVGLVTHRHPAASGISRGIARASIIVAALAMQGCASLTHYNTVRSIEAPNKRQSSVLLMDAKQRAAYPTTRTITTGTGKDARTETFRAFCAEPSPDALSNLAAQFGATVNVDARGSGAINGGFAEGAANIGLRTTSIQILRDITYRQCEAYANGGISQLGLETLQRRFQSTMVALLSIEQLTGAVRSPAVVLSGDATGTDAELIANLTEKNAAARAAVTKSETDVVDRDKAAADTAATAMKLKADFDKEKADIDVLRKMNPAAGTADKKKIDDFDAAKAAKEKAISDADANAAKALTEQAAAKKTLAERKEALDGMTAALTAAKAAGGQASTRGEIRPIVVPSALGSDATKAVAEAVTNIVRDTLSLGYGPEVCTSIIGQGTEKDSPIAEMLTTAFDKKSGVISAASANTRSVLSTCLGMIESEAKYYSSLADHVDSRTALVNAVGDAIVDCATKGCKFTVTELTTLITAAGSIPDRTQSGSSALP